jgi:peroxiredoxin
MLKPGEQAPDFPIGDRTLHQLLEEGRVAVFFFPKTFTAG